MANSAWHTLYKISIKYCLPIRQQRGATRLEQHRYHCIKDPHILQKPDEDADLEDEGEQGPPKLL